MSAADLIAVLLARHLRYDWDDAGDRSAAGHRRGPLPSGRPRPAVLEALAGTGLPLRVRQCAVSGLPAPGHRTS
jgi:hypothetical protein